MNTIQIKPAELIFKKVLLLIVSLLINSLSIAQNISIYATIPIMQDFGHLTTSRTDFRTTSNGEIWVSDRAYGLLYYNGINWSNINKLNTPILGSDSINKIFIDKQNSVWITNRVGLIRKNSNGYNAYLFGTGSNFPKKNVNDIQVFGSKTFIASNIGLYVLDTITSNWSIFNTTNSPLITDTIVSLSVDPTGNVWMAYRGGYAVYDNGMINNFTPSNPKFLNNIITDIAITHFDTLFSVKNIGIFRYANGNYEGFDDYFWRADSTSFCDPGIYYSSYGAYEYYSSKFAIDSYEKIYFVVNGINIICLDINKNLYRREVMNYEFPTNGFNPPYINFLNNDSLFYLPVMLASYRNKIVFLIEKFQSNNVNYVMMNKIPNNGSIYSDVQIPKSYVGVDQANLVANKINARILNRGDKAWDPVGQTPSYHVSSAERNTIFASSIWLGGYDQNNVLYTAGMTYRQIGRFDFWAGPIDTNAQTDSSVSNAFDHIWMTNRSDIDEFRHQFSIGNVQNGTFIVSDYILNWPAFYNYPTYPQKLAPFVDFNMDGLYNPYDGDYPDVKGDQSGWFVFNDVLAPKTETNSPAMGLEIHGMAYGYNCSDYSDSLQGLNFTTFYHYDIYNRSNRDYDSCYFAEWTDFDLGNASDDLVACNLPTNSFCVYNGDPDDDGVDGFGTCAPIQNVTFLKSPTAYLNDGIDNDHNGVIDELDEELGISTFVYYPNINNTPVGNPISTDDYYQYMTGSWLDGVHFTQGGDGRGNGPGATNTPTNFMFPGNSNSQFTSPWDMSSAYAPTDIRGIGSTGPFNLPAGGKVSFDVALITGPHDSTLNESMVAKIRAQFRNGKFENFKGTIPNIVGPKQVATSTNVVNYSVSLPNTNNTFLWTVTNGIIQSGQGTNSIDVIWGTAGVGSIVLEVFGANNPCRGKDSIAINIGLTSNNEIANEITVRIFPNPTKNTLQIETNGQTIDRAIIYNLEGKIVLQQSYVGTLNTSNLNSGAYILELLNQQNQSVVRKLFVKE
jgi:hypothetical protein